MWVPAKYPCSRASRKSSCETPRSRASCSLPFIASHTPPITERETMSSHREAPEISKDPVSDSTDLYAFVSPDNPDTVTLIANYIPLEAPAGGPNFYEFGPDVLYEIHIDSNGDGYPNVSYQFRFTTTVGTPETFLYN